KAYIDAEPLLRESFALGKQNAPDAWKTYDARASLGAALLGQNQYADAEPHLVAGYQGMKKLEADPRRRTSQRTDRSQRTEALERREELYDATNKPAGAARWRKEWEAAKQNP